MIHQRSTLLGSAALALGLAAAPFSAAAQESIDVTVVSGYAPTASWVKIFQDYYVPEVDKRLAEAGDYQINWNLGFSGTIAKPRGELEAVTSGIADMGIVVPPFHVDRLPLFNVTFVTPFSTTDLHLVTEAMNTLASEMPAFEEEWSGQGIVYLGAAATVDNYQAVCQSDKPNVSDFEGTKVLGAGSNLLYFTGVGAVGINSNLGDYYNQLQTGVGECASIWAESAAGFKLYEVAPYFIKADQGAVVSFAVGANIDFWEGLPAEVQDVLKQVSLDYGNALADYVDGVSSQALETFKENGGTITEYTAEQKEEWAQALPNMAQEWAKTTDDLGKPGSEVLTRYMDFLRENDQPVARDWDKE